MTGNNSFFITTHEIGYLYSTLKNCISVVCGHYHGNMQVGLHKDFLDVYLMLHIKTTFCVRTELTCNHRTCCMLLRSKYCMRTQCCCIWLTFKTFQRYVSFKINKGLFYWNNYYNCVRRFVVSDPKLPDSLY